MSFITGMRAVLAIGVLAAALSACGGQSYSSAEEVVDAAGFTSCTRDAPGEITIGAEESMTCAEGEIFWTTEPKALEFMVEVGAEMRDSLGTEGPFVLLGDGWGVECPERSTCEQLKSTMGGSLR